MLWCIFLQARKNKFLCIKCSPDNYEKHKEYIRKTLQQNSKHVVERENVFDDNSLISDLFPEIFSVVIFNFFYFYSLTMNIKFVSLGRMVWNNYGITKK